MPKSQEPRTEQEWIDWERAQKGLPPLPPKLTETERKSRDAQRNRANRATNVQRRVKRSNHLAPVVDIKSVEPQANQTSHVTHAKTPASSPNEPKGKRREVSQDYVTPVEGGPTELAVIEQCRDNPWAASHPAQVATARAQARIIDTPEMAPMHATASNALARLLAPMDATRKRKAGNRLQIVQRMTSKSRAVNE